MSKIGQRSGWTTGDEEGPPFRRAGVEPVTYLDDVPDDLWRDRLFWFFFPSVVIALTVWEWLHNWLHLADWFGWAFVVIDAAVYVVIGLRGPQLMRLVSRLIGRQQDASGGG